MTLWSCAALPGTGLEEKGLQLKVSRAGGTRLSSLLSHLQTSASGSKLHSQTTAVALGTRGQNVKSEGWAKLRHFELRGR